MNSSLATEGDEDADSITRTRHVKYEGKPLTSIGDLLHDQRTGRVNRRI